MGSEMCIRDRFESNRKTTKSASGKRHPDEKCLHRSDLKILAMKSSHFFKMNIHYFFKISRFTELFPKDFANVAYNYDEFLCLKPDCILSEFRDTSQKMQDISKLFAEKCPFWSINVFGSRIPTISTAEQACTKGYSSYFHSSENA